MYERMSASRAHLIPGKDARDPLRIIAYARHEAASGMCCMTSPIIGLTLVSVADSPYAFAACRTLECARLADTAANALASGTMQASSGPAIRSERTFGMNLRYIPELPGHATPRSTGIHTHVTETSIQNILSPFDDL
jgi:hypothetical protein